MITLWNQLINNHILISALAAWSLAQFLKLPIEYLITHRWNWSLLFSTGGMPSSHAALISSVTLSTGLFSGFDTPAFSVSFAVAMIVIYDAAGIRRQAGLHAEKINKMINRLLSGDPISEENLKEMIGHSPPQVITGIIFGVIISIIFWLI